MTHLTHVRVLYIVLSATSTYLIQSRHRQQLLFYFGSNSFAAVEERGRGHQQQASNECCLG